MADPLATAPQRQGHAASSFANDGRIPIVLGVTGHRSLRRDDEHAIAARLQPLLERVRRDGPHSPIVVLTSLAEGADRLVARAARDAGARLIAVLPLAPESYESDFPTETSRAEFHTLLSDERTERRIVLPQLDPAADAPGDARDLQYLLAGLFIARNSDVLIAVWDGAVARGTGGTAQIVSFRRTGRLDAEPRVRAALAAAPEPFRVVDAPLDAPQTGLVYHIPAARPDDGAAIPSMPSGWLIPSRHDTTRRARARFVRRSMATVRHRDVFNREGAEHRARHGARVDAARLMLTRGEPSITLDDRSATRSTTPEGSPALDAVRHSFALADSLAIAHQKRVYHMVLALFALVGIATISLLLRNLALTEGARRIYLAGYLLLLALADLAYLRTRMRGSQDRFQDYRALAEGLRVQFFWRLAGSAQAAADYYLRKQRSELRWIRDALRVCALRTSSLARGNIALVERLWVEDQRDYYRHASRRDGHRRLRQRIVGSALVLLSLSATIAWLWSSAAGRPAYIAIAALAALVLAAHSAYEIARAAGDAESLDPQTLRDMLAMGALGVGVALALYAALVYGGPLITSRFPRLAIGNTPLEWMLAAIGITALAGTFAHAYANIRAFGEHQKQYERMDDLFQTADDALARASSDEGPATAERILFDLGCEALGEHADWLLLHRARPIQLPTAEI